MESSIHYRDKATGWTTGVQFPAVTMMEIFSSPPLPDWVLRRIQLPIHSVAGVSFPRVKAAGTWSWKFTFI